MAATTAAAAAGSSGASLGAGTLPSGASSSSAASTSRSQQQQQQQQRRRMVCSSIAVVPATTDVSTLTSHLFSSSVRGAERLRERDLYCRRADDVHPHTISVEAGDNSFAPVRRARQANRLVVRRSAEGEGRRTMMRLATPARPKREQDLFSLQTLLEVPLLVDEGETPLDRDSRQVLEVVGTLGWVPDHRTVRVGHRFVLRQGSEAEGSVHLEVLLFQLYASSTEAKGLVPLSASTHILQAISSTPLPLSNNNSSKARPQQEPGELDASTLAERVIRDMRAIHDDLRGLVVFRPDD